MPAIEQFLIELIQRGGSDFHLASGYPPMIRKDGDLGPLNDQVLESKVIQEMIIEIMPPATVPSLKNATTPTSPMKSGDRPHGQRKIHHSGGHGGPSKFEQARAYHHHRGPRGIPPHFQEVPGEPEGSRHPYHVLCGGSSGGPAGGSRCGAGGRIERSGDHHHRAGNIGNGAPGLRNSSHLFRRHHNRPADRSIPCGPTGPDPHHAGRDHACGDRSGPG